MRREQSWSDPTGEASKLTGRSKGEPVSPEIERPRESDCGSFGSVEPVSPWRRPCRHREIGQCDVELPGDAEDGMSGRNAQRKLGTTRGSPRRSRTAKASRISRGAAKSRCACEWGGWGRLSDDGPGHYNPDPSEDPWGSGECHFMAVHHRAYGPGMNGDPALAAECTKGGCKPVVATCMSGADLSEAIAGKAPSERPAFQPY